MSNFFKRKKCPAVAPTTAEHSDVQTVAQSTAEPPQLIETVATVTGSKKKKRKTPQDNDKRKRSVVQTTRYTQEEDEYINSRVAMSGQSRADFILAAIRGHVTVQVTGVPELTREWHHIGTNLNQAVEIAHIEKSTNVKVLEDAVESIIKSRQLVVDFCTRWDAYISKIKKGDKLDGNICSDSKQGNAS